MLTCFKRFDEKSKQISSPQKAPAAKKEREQPVEPKLRAAHRIHWMMM
jgi:hypothetical protein